MNHQGLCQESPYVKVILFCFCRDIKDTTVGTLSQQITNQLLGLKGLDGKLKDMHKYLEQVSLGNVFAMMLRFFCQKIGYTVFGQ